MPPLHLRRCLLLLLFISTAATASEEVTTQQGSSSDNGIDTTHRYLSNTLLYLPHALDGFFADKQDELDSNNSTFRLMLDTLFLEGGEIDFTTTLRAKVVMPHTKNKWRLSYESSELSDQSTQTDKPIATTLGGEETTRTRSATLEAILRESDSWRASANLGLRFRSSIDPFARLRGRKEWKSSYVNTRFTQSLFFFKSDGTGTRSILDFERPLSLQHVIQASSSMTWWKKEQPLSWSQRFSYYVKLKKQRGLAYNLSVIGNNENHHQANQYIVDIRYREQFYRQWLFYELSPAVSYSREDDFKPSHSFMVRLEILFGSQKKLNNDK